MGSSSSETISKSVLRRLLLQEHRWTRAQVNDLLRRCDTQAKPAKHGAGCKCDCCVNQLELEGE